MVVGILGLVHLLFAVANFGLGGIAIGEGVVSVVAGLALITSGGVVWRSWRQASLVVLAGTIPLFVWFVFTVPAHSDWIFLYLLMIMPGLALLVITLTYVKRH